MKNATINIGGQSVELTEHAIGELNKVLSRTPVVETKWVKDEQVHTTNPNKFIQVEQVMRLETRFLLIPEQI